VAVRNAICVPDRRDAGEDTTHFPVRRSVEPRKVPRQRRGSLPRPLPAELRPNAEQLLNLWHLLTSIIQRLQRRGNRKARCVAG
jgi:hypothetical protein